MTIQCQTNTTSNAIDRLVFDFKNTVNSYGVALQGFDLSYPEGQTTDYQVQTIGVEVINTYLQGTAVIVETKMYLNDDTGVAGYGTATFVVIADVGAALTNMNLSFLQKSYEFDKPGIINCSEDLTKGEGFSGKPSRWCTVLLKGIKTSSKYSRNLSKYKIMISNVSLNAGINTVDFNLEFDMKYDGDPDASATIEVLIISG